MERYWEKYYFKTSFKKSPMHRPKICTIKSLIDIGNCQIFLKLMIYYWWFISRSSFAERISDSIWYFFVCWRFWWRQKDVLRSRHCFRFTSDQHWFWFWLGLSDRKWRCRWKSWLIRHLWFWLTVILSTNGYMIL